MRNLLSGILGPGLTWVCAAGTLYAQPGSRPTETSVVTGDDDFSEGEYSFGDTTDLGGGQEPGSEGITVDLEQAPARNLGVIVGRLIDSRTGDPILEGKISVPGTAHRTLTDLEGRFRLELPPGTYEVRYFEGTHQPARTTGLILAVGQTLDASARLTPLEGLVQETEIIAKIEKERLEGQLLARQRSAATGDIIGRAEIAKTPDSNAAEAAKRVVGASVIGGRFVFVRGLGERYTNSLLDGTPLPSPEPDRAAVPLDLFPVDVIDNITIAKTATPDVPGDFAGGSVQIQTRSIPDELVASASVSGGYNTHATFRDRLDHQGSSTDWLGFDSGLRRLPDGVPDDFPVSAGAYRPDGTEVSAADVRRYAPLLNSSLRWRTDAFTPPNHSASLVLGNGWRLPGEQRLGAVASFSYGHGYELREAVVRQFDPAAASPRGFTERIDYQVDEGEETVHWGAFGSLSYAPSTEHGLKLVVLHSQFANDLTRVFTGFASEVDSEVSGVHLQYASRGLDLAKLSGSHQVEALGRARLAWTALLSRASRNEPDTRDVGYLHRGSADLPFQTTGQSENGRHFFSDLSENGVAGTVDWMQPLDLRNRQRAKLGASFSRRRRDFGARRFSFGPPQGAPPAGCTSAEFGPECPDQTYQPAAIEEGTIELDEGTFRTDGYRSDLDVYAGYLMTDLTVAAPVRIVLGERVEATHQAIEPWDFGTGSAGQARVDAVDLLPSAAVVLSLHQNTKARASATRTLARPQLRELAPFAFSDYYQGHLTAGNPDLDLTRITNLDLRLEHFPTLREVAAVSVFHKRFADPIEPVLVPAAGSYMVTYQNTPSAYVYGVELESRTRLGFLSPALDKLSLIANLTLTRSRIQVEQTGDDTMTSLDRPMVNQAPWVTNLALDYDNEDSGTRIRVSYYVAGRRIVEVGAFGLPDAYQQPQHLVDVTASQAIGRHVAIRVGVEDLFDTKAVVTQGSRRESGNTRLEYRDGAVVFAGASYSH
ncbi:MAG: TonB-dependent receptor [Polyangiaceae bacterium]|nr:TonB-dependent receptor [Polyangiaceae bacterium]